MQSWFSNCNKTVLPIHVGVLDTSPVCLQGDCVTLTSHYTWRTWLSLWSTT